MKIISHITPPCHNYVLSCRTSHVKPVFVCSPYENPLLTVELIHHVRGIWKHMTCKRPSRTSDTGGAVMCAGLGHHANIEAPSRAENRCSDL